MIEFRHVSKDFHGKVVLSDISMEIPTGELTVLIGPSGCGKTTTLKMINRLLSPSSGEIWIDGKNIETLDKVQLPGESVTSSNRAAYSPHMTIRENIEIIARLAKGDPQAISRKTNQLMEMVDLDPAEYLDRYPTELSGGQQQRIGVIRALANDPEVVLSTSPSLRLIRSPGQPAGRVGLNARKDGKTMVLSPTTWTRPSRSPTAFASCAMGTFCSLTRQNRSSNTRRRFHRQFCRHRTDLGLPGVHPCV